MSTPPAFDGFVRARLSFYEPPRDASNTPGSHISTTNLHFNPERLHLTRHSAWVRNLAPDLATTARPEFAGTGPHTLDLDVLLDAADNPEAVQTTAQRLLDACAPTPASIDNQRPCPPWTEFRWGSLRTTTFTAIITRAEITYTLFAPNGTPLRAHCTLALEELGGAIPRQNPTSGGRGAVASHTVRDGDTLASIAYATYGDPAQWRQIAAYNHINNPAGLTPGQHLILPALEPATAPGRTR
ncbi:LysM peptidoglycan-binding domain-containing protein [Streptomyces sp. MNP-20]|uniref:CIS tube protein n=1 Tax=Streptomyces sp. MNP-20 TaxID=2721165 RepID=UPI0015551AF3|nr:LysM peptidoglycan-binding domain-containing protein [Streptomyces sp. MNP-20]